MKLIACNWVDLLQNSSLCPKPHSQALMIPEIRRVYRHTRVSNLLLCRGRMFGLQRNTSTSMRSLFNVDSNQHVRSEAETKMNEPKN